MLGLAPVHCSKTSYQEKFLPKVEGLVIAFAGNKGLSSLIARIRFFALLGRGVIVSTGVGKSLG